MGGREELRSMKELRSTEGIEYVVTTIFFVSIFNLKVWGRRSSDNSRCHLDLPLAVSAVFLLI